MSQVSKIIVALDTPNLILEQDRILSFVDEGVSIFKFGLWSILDHNFSKILDWMQHLGLNIFLDLKAIDTPDTITKVIERCMERHIFFISLYKDMISLAREIKEDITFPRLLGVVKLTSVWERYSNDYNVVDEISFSGGNGSIMDASDNDLLNYSHRMGLINVCPGIRMPEEPSNNHKHPVTPLQAIKNGADFIVIGRHLMASINPKKTIKNIIKNMEEDSFDKN